MTTRDSNVSSTGPLSTQYAPFLPVFAAFAVLAVAMTWPLARNIRTAVAYPGDPYINTWILDWDWYATLHQPLHLFDANAFHPAKDSLAFSENLYGIALALFPLRVLGVDPLTAHNIAVLLGFAFSGFGMFVLGRVVTGSAPAGFAAGVFYAFVPFRFTQLPHVQHVFAGWVPMMLAALLYYARRPSWARAALFGAALLLNGLSNIHWLLFGTMAAALTIPIALPRPRDWTPIVVAAVFAVLLLVPFLAPYFTVSELYGMRRGGAEIAEFSARPRDWLNPGVSNQLYRRFADTRVDPERWLFPGVLGIALAAAGLVAQRNRRPIVIALLWIALGVVGSFGLHPLFSGFGAIRVPARWANIAYVGLGMLIAIAVAAVSRRRAWTAVVAAALFAVELRAAPIRWFITVRDVPPVYRWIDSEDVRIVEVPFDGGPGEYSAMRWSTIHHRPMANGASGFAPPEYAKLVSMWRAPEIGSDFVDELLRIDIDLIVVRGEEVFDRERGWLQRELERGRLFFVGRFDRGRWGDWVFTTRIGDRFRGPSAAEGDLQAFLRGEFTRNHSTFGILDAPLPGRMDKAGWFTGYALSPHGVREVNLLFNNGAVRFPAYLQPDAAVTKAHPWYPVAAPRFVRLFPARPPGVRRLTDVQVEIVDRRGARTLLEDRWLEWP